MREVTLTQYIIIAIMSLVNFGILIYTLVDQMPRSFIHLTHWSYWASSIYLSFIFIFDSMIFFRKNEKFKKLNDYTRNSYSIYCLTYEYTVTILYWILVCFGDEVMDFNTSPIKLFFHIYLHGIITVLLIVDLILTERKILRWSYIDFIVLTSFYVLYSIIVVVAIFVFDDPPYHFMRTAEFWVILLSAIGLFGLLVMSYFFHIWVIMLKNNHCYQIKDSSETKETIISKEMEL